MPILLSCAILGNLVMLLLSARKYKSKYDLLLSQNVHVHLPLAAF